ncbi:MAG: hypothetical protein HN368_14825 [Spirochaetales bacterium]|jgi:uncharacterized protein|nr:hypothetical protein [Spirochaetales bacterium]
MDTNLPDSSNIKVSVVIGGHMYDVAGLAALFNGLKGVDWYLQDLDTWASSSINEQYDLFVFYHMNSWGTLSVRNDMDDKINTAIERIGDTSQGYFIWHHALLSFPENTTYDRICNQKDRTLDNSGWEPRIDINISVDKPDHPVTRGVKNFALSGEGFVMEPCGENSVVLLSQDHPRNVPTLAWCHDYRGSRVLCWQSGHDAGEWTDHSFQQIFQQGIEWLARRV